MSMPAIARSADGSRTVNSVTPPKANDRAAAIQCMSKGFEGISTPARIGRITPPPCTMLSTVTASRGSPLVYSGYPPRLDKNRSEPSATRVRTAGHGVAIAAIWRLAAVADSADDEMLGADGEIKCSSAREISLGSLISNPVGSD